ncbi:magnesium and cobalt transport protein CorA [Dactylosporangium sp. CA-092794]|uniref:magnesium and cobalt transport protein CorA n=1 Tax=Dactylosporangium sp. CA-092794 TaxID=3239929 RepID=UPI003D8A18C1
MSTTEVNTGRRAAQKVGQLIGRVLLRMQAGERLPQLLTRPEEEAAVMDCALYVRGARQPGRPAFADAYSAARRRRNGFVWLGLFEPGWAQFTAIAELVDVDEATVDKTLAVDRRPAIERRGDVTVLTLRTARYVEHAQLTETSEVVDTGAVTLLIGRHFVVSVRHGGAGALADVREQLQQRPALLGQGPWAVGLAVVERMVGIYDDVAGQVEQDVEKLEETAFLRQGGCDVQQIYQLKRELVEFKRAVLPLQQPLRQLTATSSDVPPGLRQYFSDVYGRLNQVVERVGSYNELLDSILQARLAQVGLDQNNDMRKIAAWAAIAAVPTAIAGIYGMNFDHMPELHWRFGYGLVVGLMATAMVILYRSFRKSGWL